MMRISSMMSRSLSSKTPLQSHTAFEAVRMFSKSRSALSFLDNRELFTVPNVITLSRIIASPGLAYAVAYDMKGIALGGCILFGFSDWLDGYIARRYNQQTALGACLDPLADKVLIGSLVVGLAVKGLFPLPLASIIIGRDVVIVSAAFAMRFKEKPVGAPFFDAKHTATFEIVPSDLSKLNTCCQFLLLTTSLGNFAFDLPSEIFVEPLWWITAVTTMGSGVAYLDGSGLRRIPKSSGETEGS